VSALEKFAHFRPAGPVAEAFMADQTNYVRTILGPVGGGKSVSCIFDCLKNACEMPVCTDGVIRYRVAIIGATYGQMERNLLPTWTEWIPKDGGDWTDADFTGGGGRHATHKIAFDTIRNGQRVRVHFEALFAAIGEYAVEQFMRGFEPTAFWLYEMDLLPAAVLDQAIFRMGRYPPRRLLPEGVNFRSYVIGDLNAPDIDSWFYKLFEEERPEGFALYRQPSGLSARAENLHNLPEGYYERQLQAMKNRPNLVKRFIHAQYGPASDGEPVYCEYSDDRHRAPASLKPMKGVPIRLGLDQGVQRPAAIIGQRLPNGQARILGEVVPGRAGPARFADAIRRELAEIAPGHRVEVAYADPAGFYGADTESGELAWAEIVQRELNVPVLPAPSNELSVRLDAVRSELIYNIDGENPGLLISPRCTMLRKGFASHYRYRIERVGTSSRTSDKPEKNDFSNPHDALQYLMLGEKGRYGVVSGGREMRQRSNRELAVTHASSPKVRNATRLFG
jgi:hypothetical protein